MKHELVKWLNIDLAFVWLWVDQGLYCFFLRLLNIV